MITSPAIQALVITLREGLEAFLIVAISLAYLKKTGRTALVPAVHWGIAASVALSLGAAYLFSRADNQSLWEGVLALVAAALVSSLVLHMWRAGRHLRSDIQDRLGQSASGNGAWLGVFGFTVLMITREGMETALLMNALVMQVREAPIVLGATAGLLGATILAWLWSRYGHKVNLTLFFQVTAIFLMVFVVQLVIYGMHELTEAGAFPYSQTLHWMTEPYGPDGRWGHLLSYSLVLLPTAWLALAALRQRLRAAPASER